MKEKDRSIPIEINDFIQKLYMHAQSLPNQLFKQWVFNRLHHVISFDSGAWINGINKIEVLSSNLNCDSYIENQHDGFVSSITAHLLVEYRSVHALADKVIIYPGHNTQKIDWYSSEFYQKFCIPEGIEQVLIAIFRPNSLSSSFHIFTLCRHSKTYLFSPTNISTLNFLLPNLFEAYRINLLSSITTDSITGLSQDTQQDRDHLLRIWNAQSTKKKQICRFLIEGKSDKEIARMSLNSHFTVSNHLKKLYQVFNVNNRESLIKILLQIEI